MANEGYHEPIDELTDATRDMHRAITSLMEELEAVDWYNQPAGTFYARASQPILTGATTTIYEAAADSSNEYLANLPGSAIPQHVIRTGGSNVVGLQAAGAITAGVEFQIAATATLNDAELFTDGARSGTGDQSLTMPTTAVTFNVGSSRVETAHFNGHIAEIRYYKVRKDNQFLEDLSNGLIPE